MCLIPYHIISMERTEVYSKYETAIYSYRSRYFSKGGYVWHNAYAAAKDNAIHACIATADTAQTYAHI